MCFEMTDDATTGRSQRAMPAFLSRPTPAAHSVEQSRRVAAPTPPTKHTRRQQ